LYLSSSRSIVDMLSLRSIPSIPSILSIPTWLA
jgi:hypothetical protein